MSHTSTGDPSPGVDVQTAVAASGCQQPLENLEDCIGTHDRDWRRCQREVRELKMCMKSVSARSHLAPSEITNQL